MASCSSDCCAPDLRSWFFFSPRSCRSDGGDDAPGDADLLGETIAFAGGDGVVNGVDRADCTGLRERLKGAADATAEAAAPAGAGGRVVAGLAFGDAMPSARGKGGAGVLIALV